jgi:NAD(P)-dependent dehydrogenase (short-subunit alcohol dehydrogenase family)
MSHGIFDLKGKKALVTGGAIGIGRASATALALGGADVAIVGRTRETAERTCASLRELGVQSFFVKCDVGDLKQIRATHQEVADRFGRLDIAVNNAGRGIIRSALAVDQADWDRMIDVNLAGVFWCAQAQAQQMTRQALPGGKIINIASMYATVAGGNCAYNASKAGVTHLTRSLAAEWGAENINVNCISPGWMLTPGNRFEPALRAKMRELTPLGSLMQYRDIYGAVMFLASAASDFVTGHDLVIDGGHTITTYLAPYKRNVPPRTSPEDEEKGMKEDLGHTESLQITERAQGIRCEDLDFLKGRVQ